VKKLLWQISLFAACLLLTNAARSQSGNSNIGTEFWTAYMVHINGATGSSASQMILYIASDVATTGTVSITDNSFTAINFSVTPNVATLVAIPAAAYLGNTNGSQTKGLHITSKNPIAVYAHIYASSVSGATLLLPVNTMANDYYSLNYTQLSNASPSYSSFMVIGTEDNTTVEITPSAALIDGSKANTKFIITLNKGQVYQGLSTTDLTGTHIASVSNGSGCKKIAVFSGSNKIYIGAPNQSSDNLFQQVYPTASWGKNYITVPLKTRNYDVFRIVLSDPATTVTLNGTVVPLSSFTNGLYYQFNSQATNVISADKPIQVIQYAVTQGNGIAGTKAIAGDVGDPEMIYLNPLEQNIDHVTLYSTNKYLILNGFINVVIPTSAVSSFLLDGVAQTANFYTVPGNTAYSYAQLPASVNATHNIAASQGFNAIAYGFGQTESYGYAAGTNVKNLNEYAQFTTPGTSSVASSGCAGVSFEPQVVLPYATSSITWDFGNGATPVVQTAPQYINTIVKGTQTLYVYDYGQPVVYPTAGTYAVNVTVVDPITTVCGSNEVVSLNYTVSNPPASKFSSRDTVCIADTIGFKDQSTGTSGINGWHWNFGNSDTSNAQNPVYKFLSPGNYTVGLTVSSGTACPSSVYTKNIHVRAAPVAAFSFASPDCETQGVTFTDQSTTAEGKVTQWIWNYGDGSPVDTRTNNQPFTHTYSTAGSYTIALQVLTNNSCTSSSVSHSITIHPHAVVDFGLPDVCLANAIASFIDKTTISDNSNAQFKYLWNFGDVNASTANPNTSILQNPTHKFTAGGNYTISLSVTTKDTCTTTLTKTFLVSGQADFASAANACPADSVLFTDKTNGATAATSAWHWDFGTGDTSNVQNPKYPFTTPGNYTVKLTVTGHNGCSTTSYSTPIHIYKKPVADFTFSTLDCETGQITLTDKSTATEGTVAQWVWDYGDGSPIDTRITGTPFTHVFATAGTYVVKLYSITNLGCASPTVSKAILVHPKPVVDFGLPDVCLANATASFTDKSTITDGSGAQFKYLWNFGDAYATVANPNASIVKNPTHQYTKAGTYTISLTVTSKDTCTATATKTFIISGLANFTAAANACPVDSVQFTDKTDGATKASSAWHWVFGSTGDTSNVQNPKYAFKNPGNYTVSLTVTGHNGCSTTSYSAPIHIYTKPVAKFSYSAIDCETQSITFTDQSTSTEGTNTQWIWDYGDGSLLDTRTSAAAFTHTFSKAGTYNVKLYTISSLGCASLTITKAVVVYPLPTKDFTIPDVCLNDTYAQFTAVSTIADNTTSTYSWDFGDAARSTVVNPNTASGLTAKHKYTATGNYNVHLTITSAHGCVVDTIKQFTVNGSSPQSKFVVLNSATLCSNREVFFVDSASVPGFGNGSVTSVDMYYDYGNNPTVKVHYAHPTYGQLFRHTYKQDSVTRSYQVVMDAYSGASCVNRSTQTISVLGVPTITFPAVAAVCVNANPFQMSITQHGPTGNPGAVFTGNGVSSAGIFNPSIAGVGIQVIKCIYTSANGCADTLSQTVTVEPVATVSAGADVVVLAGGHATIKATATGNNLTYLWSPAAGLNRADVLQPIAAPSVNTKYTLTVISTTQNVPCAVTSSVTVKVLQAPAIPSGFTPNGDGTNDSWIIQNLDTYPGATVDVFNRNGEKVFSSVGYSIPWDGRYNGADLPVGTYYYIIDPKNGRSKITGYVAIVR
jgi:gliding motility-associated-like protein